MAPLAQLATWNVWLIPNSSSELGPRPLKQARRLCQLLEEGAPAPGGPGGLRLIALQEVWAWHCGCAKLLFACTAWLPPDLRPRLRRISPWFDVLCDALGFLALLLGLLSGLVLRIFWWVPGYERLLVWNPRRLLLPGLSGAGFTHAVGLEPSFGSFALFDSGLFMVANQEPLSSGHIPFTNSSWATEERLANKGLLWALFGDEQHGTLVVNLHGRCASAMEGGDSDAQVDPAFVADLCARLQKLLRDFASAAAVVEAYVVGDWNIPQQSDFWRKILDETGLEDVTSALRGRAFATISSLCAVSQVQRISRRNSLHSGTLV